MAEISCRNNHEDVRQLTEYAHAHRLATDYHINETPMLEQDEHFKHLNENPTYIRPEDWRSVDALMDWIIVLYLSVHMLNLPGRAKHL